MANDNVDNPKQSHAWSSLSSIIAAFYSSGARYRLTGLGPRALFSLFGEYFWNSEMDGMIVDNEESVFNK